MSSPRKPKPPATRATCRSIAKACGLSYATVARVLGGYGRVADKTRSRIQKEAERQGYQRDPGVSALVRRRWDKGPHTDSITLGWLEPFENPRELGQYRGAMERAAELGYRLERFFIPEFPDTRKLSKVLFNRGIKGVLIRAFPNDLSLDLEWQRFCCVFVGPENDDIHIHNVQPDFRAVVRMASAKCRDAGFRRPGFCLMNYLASGTNEPIRAQAGLERERFAITEPDQPPILEWINGNYEAIKRDLQCWLRESRPDVVIMSHFLTWNCMKELEAPGQADADLQKVSKILPAISLRGRQNLPDLASVGLRRTVQGRQSVDLVHQHLQYGRIGIPEIPMRMLVPPQWHPGASFPE